MTKCFKCGKEISRGKGYRIKSYKKISPLHCLKCWKKRPRNWQTLLGLILMIVIILPLVWLKRWIRS